MGLAPMAGAGNALTFDCVALTAKSGVTDPVCALFEQRLREAGVRFNIETILRLVAA